MPQNMNVDANGIAKRIVDAYNIIINKFMPLKKLPTKEIRAFIKPWITKGLKVSIKKKNNLFHISKQINDKKFSDEYKSYRNLLTLLKKKSHDNYYREKLNLYGQNKSKTWKIINEITKRKKIRKCNIKYIVNENGSTLCDTQSIADCLNCHFGSIGEKMASKINLENADPLKYIAKQVQQSVFPPFTDTNKVSNLLTKLDINKGSGYDLISNRVLKATSEVITPYIVYLFNLCLMQGVFPDTFKIAQVVPLFKGGVRENPTSYRFISLLPALGKIFEKIIATGITNFFDKHNLFAPCQLGFRAKLSTEYAVQDIYEKLLFNLDQGLSSCAIFLDLANAFDTVSYNILIKKKTQKV